MFLSKNHDQTILEISQREYISATADSYSNDRQARELSRHTLKFYSEFLRTFIEYYNANSLTFIQETTADFMRHYFLAFGEIHNPGSVYAAYRTLHAFFQWLVKEEIMKCQMSLPNCCGRELVKMSCVLWILVEYLAGDRSPVLS